MVDYGITLHEIQQAIALKTSVLPFKFEPTHCCGLLVLVFAILGRVKTSFSIEFATEILWLDGGRFDCCSACKFRLLLEILRTSCSNTILFLGNLYSSSSSRYENRKPCLLHAQCPGYLVKLWSLLGHLLRLQWKIHVHVRYLLPVLFGLALEPRWKLGCLGDCEQIHLWHEGRSRLILLVLPCTLPNVLQILRQEKHQVEDCLS